MRAGAFIRNATGACAVLCALVLWRARTSPWQRGGHWERSGRAKEESPQATQRMLAEAPDDAVVAVCTMVKIAGDDPQWVDGRAEDLHEWVDYQRSIGIGRLYLYDHLSPVTLNTTLRDEIASGYVVYEYITYPLEWISVSPQLIAYDACQQRYGSRHRYLAMIDADEFFVLMDTRPGAPKTLGRLLDDYYSIRPFGGMVVPWVPFGSSGHVTRPKGGVLRNYWRCLPRWSGHSLHVKTIVTTQHANVTKGPHSWRFKEPYYAITQQFERFDHVVLPPEHGTVHKLALFHYVVKSLEDFRYKMIRGGGSGTRHQMDFFNVTESEAICNCTIFTAPGAPNECSDGSHPYVVSLLAC